MSANDSTIQTWQCHDCGGSQQGWSLDQYDAFNRVHADCHKISWLTRQAGSDSMAAPVVFIAAIVLFAIIGRLAGWF